MKDPFKPISKDVYLLLDCQALNVLEMVKIVFGQLKMLRFYHLSSFIVKIVNVGCNSKFRLQIFFLKVKLALFSVVFLVYGKSLVFLLDLFFGEPLLIFGVVLLVPEPSALGVHVLVDVNESL